MRWQADAVPHPFPLNDIEDSSAGEGPRNPQGTRRRGPEEAPPTSPISPAVPDEPEGPAGGGRQPQASSEAAGTPCRACREPPAACRPLPAGTRSPAGLAPGRPKKRNRLLLLCRGARSRTRTAGWVKSRCGRAELPLPAGRAAGRTEPPPLPGPIQTRGAETGSPGFPFKGGGARPAVWPPPTPSPPSPEPADQSPGRQSEGGRMRTLR